MKKRNLSCPFHAALAYQAGQHQYQVMVIRRTNLSMHSIPFSIRNRLKAMLDHRHVSYEVLPHSLCGAI